MKSVCWLLIVLAAVAFAIGTAIAFTHQVFLLEPVGYWRGAVGFLLFAIALRAMDARP
jgi:predicted outer membrane lipoprotein